MWEKDARNVSFSNELSRTGSDTDVCAEGFVELSHGERGSEYAPVGSNRLEAEEATRQVA